MSLYVLGDLQGCRPDFEALLESLAPGPRDELWICGDLINRGPDSLGMLRRLRAWRGPLRCVLGNHDLAVLAQARRAVPKLGATARELLGATDAGALLDWLQAQPLLVEAQGLTMVHAGLAPQWTADVARQEAARVAATLRGAEALPALAQMYGDEPDLWTPQLSGAARFRYAVNVLTRMRYVDAQGRLELESKEGIGAGAKTRALWPWFAHPQRRNRALQIAFGHWSTLGRVYWPEHGVWGLDSGCVWGGRLSALRWPERRIYSRPCPAHQQPG